MQLGQTIHLVVLLKCLIGFTVPNLPETAEDVEALGFAAEDIGDVLNKILLRIRNTIDYF